jgi:hypothetical protein
MNVIFFDGPVDFVQVVKMKIKPKTTISGKIEFMVCNDQQCLPPVEVPFSIPLQ